MEVVKNLGPATAYGYAKEKGYQGTEEEFAELMASYASVAQQAEQSAEDAEAWAKGTRDGQAVPTTDPTYEKNSKHYAEQAEFWEINARQDMDTTEGYKIAANSAKIAAETAQGKAEAAQTVAENAQTASETAQGKAENAQTAAENARTAAETAQGKAETAQTAAETAQGKAEDAQTAAETAESNAEAWAVGQRSGADVPSTDPAYNNNAKYYAGVAQAGNLTMRDVTNSVTYILQLQLISGKPAIIYEEAT